MLRGMRFITPIEGGERLLARGSYLYERDGAPAGVTEPWTIHERLGGERVTRVERDARTAAGTTLLVEAVSRGALDEAHIERFDVRFHNERGAAVREARARYQWSDGVVSLERAIDGRGAASEAVHLPRGAVVSPLMRVFLGPVILAVAARGRGEVVPVLTPFLEDPADASRLLGPVLDERSAAIVGEDRVEVDGRDIPTRCYRYVGRHYDDASRFWLDARGILVRYRFRQRDGSVWTIRLTEAGAC